MKIDNVINTFEPSFATAVEMRLRKITFEKNKPVYLASTWRIFEWIHAHIVENISRVQFIFDLFIWPRASQFQWRALFAAADGAWKEKHALAVVLKFLISKQPTRYSPEPKGYIQVLILGLMSGVSRRN